LPFGFLLPCGAEVFGAEVGVDARQAIGHILRCGWGGLRPPNCKALSLRVVAES
jgi:hypothetical protein